MNKNEQLIFLDKIQSLKSENRFLIDYANLFSGTFRFQNKLLNKKSILKFEKNKKLGLPILIPKGLNIFDYEKEGYFFYSKSKILKHFYNLTKKNYEPFKEIFRYGQFYSSNLKPKKKCFRLINKINNYNNFAKDKIKLLKLKHKSIAAFQTRNIPHSGHEEIIKYLLTKTNHVVINPLIGPKKRGDISPKALFLAFRHLKKYYGDKISFLPIIANMFYAGPREAIHHSNIRQQFGFTHFTVGRDHAGHGNAYNYDSAPKIIRKFRENFTIDLITHYGSYWSKKFNKIVVLKRNFQNKKDLIGISGSEFRKCLKKKLLYKFARKNLQIYLIKQNILK